MKIFLDCGSNLGQGYTYFREKYGNDYEYILFEPNPNCYKKLVEQFGTTPNIAIRNEAVYIENCTKKFKFVTDFCVGGSLIENHNSAYSNKKQETTVSCIDITTFIDSLSYDEIIIKFDVESSEYDILEKLIETKIIFKIKKIYCEFHTQYMNDGDKAIYVPRENKILDFVHKNNIDFEIWH